MKIYVGNLPAYSDKKLLQEIFEEYGKVNIVSLKKEIVDSKLIKYAIIKIFDEKLAKKAIIDLNGHQLGNSIIQVNPARTGVKDRRKDTRVGGRRDYDPQVL